MQTWRVSCKVRTEYLNITQKIFVLPTQKKGNVPVINQLSTYGGIEAYFHHS
jgi:hypothetical protein